MESVSVLLLMMINKTLINLLAICHKRTRSLHKICKLLKGINWGLYIGALFVASTTSMAREHLPGHWQNSKSDSIQTL